MPEWFLAVLAVRAGLHAAECGEWQTQSIESQIRKVQNVYKAVRGQDCPVVSPERGRKSFLLEADLRQLKCVVSENPHRFAKIDDWVWKDCASERLFLEFDLSVQFEEGKDDGDGDLHSVASKSAPRSRTETEIERKHAEEDTSGCENGSRSSTRSSSPSSGSSSSSSSSSSKSSSSKSKSSRKRKASTITI
eukprot:scaffold1786_cov250-Pinguiococcus_pyrenoidosus.AAC.10